MPITLYQPIVFGDTSGNLRDHAHGNMQTMAAQPGLETLVGDALALVGHAVGGDDTLRSGWMAPVTLIGDAVTITDHARGGDDDVYAGTETLPTALGDAVTLSGHAQGGNDSVTASGGRIGNPYGTGYGDSETITDHAKGGDDVVKVGLAGTAYGDAETLSGFAIGGDDTLIGFAGVIPGYTAQMYGDGAELLDHSRGGNDTLISGEATNELMWGDAASVASSAKTGADTFVFSPRNGQDRIMDFESGKDHIELKGYGFASFADVAGLVQSTPDGALITFDTISYGAHDSILVVGLNQLSASDFILN